MFVLNNIKNLILIFFIIVIFFLFKDIYFSLGYYSDDPWWFFSKRFYDYENLNLKNYFLVSLTTHEGYHLNRYLIMFFKEIVMFFFEDVSFAFRFLNIVNLAFLLLNIFLLHKIFLCLKINFLPSIIGYLILLSYPIIGEIRFWPTSLTPYSPSLSILFFYIYLNKFDQKNFKIDFFLLSSIFVFEHLFFIIFSIIFVKYLYNSKLKTAFIILFPNLFFFLFIKIFISNYNHSPNFEFTQILTNFSKIFFIFITPEIYSHPIEIKNYIFNNLSTVFLTFIFVAFFVIIGIYVDYKNKHEVEYKIPYLNLKLIFIIFFTYFPNLFWDISPRHNYLPLGMFAILIAI